jgi:hypothetical protein
MILISYPHVSCYNSYIDTHNYNHKHHTLKHVSLNSTRHSAYEMLCAHHLNIKQLTTTKCALMCSLQLPQHSHYFPQQNQSICFYAGNWVVIKHLNDGHSELFLRRLTGGVKNERSYISTPFHMFWHFAQSQPLPIICHAIYIIFKKSKFFNSLYHKEEG